MKEHEMTPEELLRNQLEKHRNDLKSYQAGLEGIVKMVAEYEELIRKTENKIHEFEQVLNYKKGEI